MEKLIHDKENHILFDLERLESALLKLAHFSKLDRQSRIQLREIQLAFQSLETKLFKEPRPSIRNLADKINAIYVKDPSVEAIHVTIHLNPNPNLEKTSFVNFPLHKQNE